MKALLERTHLYEPTRAAWRWVSRPEWRRRRARDRAKLQFYARLAPRGSLCFDIGANRGDYTAALLAVGVGRVVAVDPQAECVHQLTQRWGAADGRVTVVAAAVGPAEGSVTLHTPAEGSQIASCSPEWLEAVKASGRFAPHEWVETVEVPMTTLDGLIATHGRPAFCKIDVEGFELDVLRALSTPIPRVSFEFSPETIERTIACVDRLATLGPYQFNYCAHGFYRDALPAAHASDAFRETLRRLPPQAMKWGGDVYATLPR